jgi:ankyrin repeat protein
MARLHLDSIASLDNRRSVKRSLQKLPTTYGELYSNAMERIKCQEPERYARASQVLSWLSYALSPLTVSALQHALSVEPGDTELYQDAMPDAEDLVSVCAGLVTIDEASSVIRLVHYTTREYFNQLRHIAFPDGQEIIASTCLTYLSYDDFSHQCHTQLRMDSRFRKYAFYLYAAEFWALHVIGGGLETRLRDRVIAFVEDGKRYSAEEAMLKRRTSVWGCWMTGILTDRSINFIREDPPLHTAVVYGLIQTITFLITERQYSTEVRNRLGQTALHRAAETGQAEAVKKLLELDAKGSAIVKHGRLGDAGPVHFATHGAHATHQAHLQTVRVLLDHGLDVNYQEPEHNLTALHIAALLDTDVTKLLLDRGADVNAKLRRPMYNLTTAPELGPLTCLHLVMLFAEDRGALQRAQFLLTKGIEVNAQTGRGNTALHQAILRPEGFAQLLMEHGADVHIRNKAGQSVLQLACERGRLSWLAANNSLHALVKSMGNPSLLHQAIWTQNQPLVVQCLRNGMDPTAKDAAGKTPLDYCVTSGNVELVKLLIDHIESQNLPPAAGSVALGYAVANMTRFDYTDVETWPKAIQIGRLLVPYRTAHRPDDAFDFVHTRFSGTNKTFLILAAESNRPALVEFLLDCGSDMTCQDNYGETACHYAAEVNYPEIVKILVERGSNLEILDNTERTPLICALLRGNDAIINYLRDVIASRSQTAIQQRPKGEAA